MTKKYNCVVCGETLEKRVFLSREKINKDYFRGIREKWIFQCPYCKRIEAIEIHVDEAKTWLKKEKYTTL